MFYSENSNVIKGLGFRYGALTMRSIEGLIREKIIEKYPGGLITNFAADLKDILYTISYVTTANLRMRTSKVLN